MEREGGGGGEVSVMKILLFEGPTLLGGLKLFL